MVLRQLIEQALASAEINGYLPDLKVMTVEQLTDDLMDFDADIAQYPRVEVLEAVMEVRGHL
jgi:hypothetical protein